jgi:K+/H+ antiporter YhaU regulatory subunit KhtT
MEPRYIRIAVDLAESIAEKNLKEGTKISGRSVLASRYNVSPETIRKAIALLKDYEIVSSSPKKGIEILNEDNATEFLRDIKASQTYNDAKEHLSDLLEQQKVINQEIRNHLKLLLELEKKPRHTNRFFPYELTVPDDSKLVHQTIENSNFWHHTGATIVYIARKEKNYVSPGPDFKFKIGDRIFFVCQDHDYHRTREFIKAK